ncbi:hypothetical protein N9112_00345 [bacterium]|nr:hypothetical protein [bacterium]
MLTKDASKKMCHMTFASGKSRHCVTERCMAWTQYSWKISKEFLEGDPNHHLARDVRIRLEKDPEMDIGKITTRDQHMADKYNLEPHAGYCASMDLSE